MKPELCFLEDRSGGQSAFQQRKTVARLEQEGLSLAGEVEVCPSLMPKMMAVPCVS